MKSDTNELKTLFHKSHIIPDVIARTPDNLLQVEYNGIAINPGDVLSKNQVVQKPEIRWRPINESALYTLYLVNPDVPSRFEPYEAEWQHWTVHNIPGIQKNSGFENWIDSGDTVVEYSSEYKHPDSEGFYKSWDFLTSYLQFENFM